MKNIQMNPIVVTEFPKSGGTWITSMLGEALDLPRRDIYVRPGFDLFDIKSHPWYAGDNELDFPSGSVIKSHEFPNSGLINFDARFVHLVRDGRDVVISKWYFDQDFCVKNGISQPNNIDFDEYVKGTAAEWARYVDAWLAQGVLVVRYEDFLMNPVEKLAVLIKALTGLDVRHERVVRAVEACSKRELSRVLGNVFKHNTFVRKGISGDWVNHFSDRNINDFNLMAGDTLLSLGYESTPNWGCSGPFVE
jgi:hypothetical protein